MKTTHSNENIFHTEAANCIRRCQNVSQIITIFICYDLCSINRLVDFCPFNDFISYFYRYHKKTHHSNGFSKVMQRKILCAVNDCAHLTNVRNASLWHLSPSYFIFFILWSEWCVWNMKNENQNKQNNGL